MTPEEIEYHIGCATEISDKYDRLKETAYFRLDSLKKARSCCPDTFKGRKTARILSLQIVKMQRILK